LAIAGYQHRLYLECLPGSSGHKATKAESVDVRELETKDADAFVAFRQGPDADLFLARLQRGQRCFAAFVGSRLASVSWAVKNQATLWALNADFYVEDGTAYIFDSYTHPEFRGKRLQSSIFQRICEYCKDKKIGKIVTFVAATNNANLRSRTRLGFAVTGAVRRLRFGPLVWYLSTGSAPELERHGSRK
jgi:L-amino acid N-acyltransferase YncA